MTETVLITGAAGFLGGLVLDEVRRRGECAIGCDVRGAGDIARVDISDPDAIRQIVAEEGVRSVVHCAAFGIGTSGLKSSADAEPGRAALVNVGGTATLAAVCASLDVRRFVYVSSTTVFGWRSEYQARRVTEEAQHNPHTMYGACKSAAEFTIRRICGLKQVESVSIRVPLVYGVTRWYGGALGPLANMVRGVGSGDLELNGNPVDLISGTDAARGIVSTLFTPSVRPVYHLNGQTASFAELGELAVRRQGLRGIRVVPRDSRSVVPLIDDSRAREDLGFAPASTAREDVIDAIMAPLT